VTTTPTRARYRAIGAVAVGLAAAATGLATAVSGAAGAGASNGTGAAPSAPLSSSTGSSVTAPASASSAASAALSVASVPHAALVAPAGTPKTTVFNSLHWVGYTFPAGHVTGVRADWTEPRVTGKKGSEEFVWLGVGGWDATDDNIVQAGTFVYFPPAGGRNEGIWWERVPTDSGAQFPLVAADPGDHIQGTITLVAGTTNKWRISIVDTTLGTSFIKIVKFKSLEADPSFVVEDPNKGAPGPNGPFYPFPAWKTVTFTHIQARIGKTWTAVAKLARYRVNMVRGAKTYATAGALTKQSSFTATQK
jgi:hypothetical protein